MTRGGKAHALRARMVAGRQRIAFADKDGKLFVLTLAGRRLQKSPTNRRHDPRLRLVARQPLARILDDRQQQRIRSLYIWSWRTATLHRSATSYFDEYTPVWDPEGNYLYYFSRRIVLAAARRNSNGTSRTDRIDRHLRGGAAQGRQTSVPAGERRSARSKATTRRTRRSPRTRRTMRRRTRRKDEDKKNENPKPISIDFDGLSGRVGAVPVAADNYSGLSAVKGHLLYIRASAVFYGRDGALKPELRIYRLEGAQGDDAGRKRRRLRAVDRRQQGHGAQGSAATSPYDARPRARTRPRRVSLEGHASRHRARGGMGDDVRRSLAALSRSSSTSPTCTATTGWRCARKYEPLLA